MTIRDPIRNQVSEMKLSEKGYKLIVKVYQLPFILVMRRTMLMLFPFAVLGSIASVFNVSILSRTGFIGNVFYITQWLPHVARIRSMFAAFSMMTVKILAVLAAYQAGSQTARLYHKNPEMTGMTGMLAFLIIALRPVQRQYGPQTFLQFSVNNNLMGIQGLLIGILIGFITGQIFRIFNRKPISIRSDSFSRAYRTIIPVMITLGVAIIVNQLIIQAYKYQIPSGISNYYQALSSKKHGLIMTLILGAWSSFLAWLGLSGPYNHANFNDDPAAVADLTYALKHHSPWNVPYKYTQTTLYHSFGTFGGVGSTLALVIAIIIVARTSRYHQVARWAVFPTLFNANQPILLGIPVLFNPIFLVPFVVTPVVNMLIAALAIHFQIMPPVTYPSPLDTPGALSAFIGTGGNFMALLIGILIMTLDVLIYIPFVKLFEQVHNEMKIKERQRLRMR